MAHPNIQRPDGRIAYDVDGTGPLVVLSPGMGDLRSTYRHLAPLLVADGFRVACVDLRGHGNSDATFTAYGDPESASDLAAVIEQLGGPAVVVGNSMSAGAAILLAQGHPHLVSGVVLTGPFVRNPSQGRLAELAFRLMLAGPWRPVVWRMFLPRLYAGRRPDDLDAHIAAVVESIRRPGYGKAFQKTAAAGHDDAERAIATVKVPALVVMGAQDPDFPSPEAEANWIGTELTARVEMIDACGHYPHAQHPQRVAELTAAFAKGLA